MAERGKFFKETMVSEPRKGWHNLSFDNSFSCNAGILYPTKRLEIFPGDTIHDRSSAMARLQPLVSPVMGKMNLFSYHFIVRNRDIWTQWDKFITNYDQKKTWQQNTSFVPPEMPYIDISEVYTFKGASGFYFNPDDVNVLSLKNVMYLICFTHNGKHYCVNTPRRITRVTEYPMMMIAYIPHKSDLLSGYPNYWVDPFGPGTLMEYLGINIDGFRKELEFSFELLLSGLQVVWNISDGTPWHPTQFTDTDITTEELNSLLFREGEGGFDAYGDDFTIGAPTKEFMEDHIILGISGQPDKSGYSGINFTFFADGRTAQVGTPTLDISWPDSPLDPANASLFDFKLTDLVLRAYRFIYDEYFRDENYIQVNPNTDFSRDGNDLDWANHTSQTIYEYLTFVRKSFEHDLYTSALPQAQRGNPVRFLPDLTLKKEGLVALKSGETFDNVRISSGGANYLESVGTLTQDVSRDRVVVDLSAATIENLRFFNSLQRYLERKARTGGRYYEYMIGQWGYEINDAKLNRPIYLGGDKTPVQISEVLQTSSSNVDTGQPLGDLAGRGVAIGRDNSIEFTAPDYGFLIELCAIVPRTSYGQGIAPLFKRFNYMDYPLPDFANLGEESIKKRELYATLRKANDDSTFGYTARYYQFKYERDQIHGDMLTSLRHWNFARIFDGVPYNGKDFLEVDPSYRQFAVTDKNVDHFTVTMWHDIEIHRALPEISIPSL